MSPPPIFFYMTYKLMSKILCLVLILFIILPSFTVSLPWSTVSLPRHVSPFLFMRPLYPECPLYSFQLSAPSLLQDTSPRPVPHFHLSWSFHSFRLKPNGSSVLLPIVWSLHLLPWIIIVPWAVWQQGFCLLLIHVQWAYKTCTVRKNTSRKGRMNNHHLFFLGELGL